MIPWTLWVYFLAAIFIVSSMLAISHYLGQRHRSPHSGIPFESGVASAGTARLRFSAKFYLVAMFFVIFDVESAFIFAWAVAARDVGWSGYWTVFVFICVLVAALVYEWRIGALDWYPVGRRR